MVTQAASSGPAVAVAAVAFSLRPNIIGLFASVLNSLSVPIMLLSGILLPMSLAPHWLRIIADINPFKHTVEAARAMFRGDFGASEVYLGTGLTVGVSLALVVVGARSFARENA